MKEIMRQNDIIESLLKAVKDDYGVEGLTNCISLYQLGCVFYKGHLIMRHFFYFLFSLVHSR